MDSIKSMRRFRRFFIISLVAGVVLVLGVTIAIQSGWLDSWARQRILDALQSQVQGTIQLGQATIRLIPPRAQIRELTISVPGDAEPEPAVRIRAASVNLWDLDLGGRRRTLGRVRLDGLRLRIERNEDGWLNLASLRRGTRAESESEREDPILIRLGIGELRLDDALVTYEGHPFRLDSSAGQFSMNLRFNSVTKRYRGQFQLRDFYFEAGDLRLNSVQLGALVDYGRDLLRLSDLRFRSNAIDSQMTASLALSSLPTYEVDVARLTVDLEQMDMFRTSRAATGRLDLSGRATGEGSEFEFRGNGTGQGVEVLQERVDGLAFQIRADRHELDVQEATWDYRGGRASAAGHLYWSESRSSEFRFDVAGVDVPPLLAELGVDFPLPVGTAEAKGRARWAGVDLAGLGVSASAGLTGRLGTTEALIPLTATTRLHLYRGRFVLADTALQSGPARVNGEGMADLDGTLLLRWETDSATGDELIEIAREGFGFQIPPLFDDAAALPAAARLQGELSRNPGGDLKVGGELFPTPLVLDAAPDSQVAGHFEWSDSGLRLDDVVVLGDDFGASGSLDWAVEPPDTVALNVSASDVPILPLLNLFRIDHPLTGGRLTTVIEASQQGGDRSASGSVKISSLTADQMALGDFTAQLRVDRNRLTLSDSRLLGASGNAAGRFSWDITTATAALDASFDGIRLERLPGVDNTLPVAGLVNGRINAAGPLTALDGNLRLTGQSVQLGSQEFGTFDMTGRISAGQLDFEFGTSIVGQALSGQGRLGLATPFPFKADASIVDADLAPFWTLTGQPTPAGIDGRASGDLRVSGKLSSPESLDVRFDLQQLQLTREAATLQLTSANSLRLEDGRLLVNQLELSDGTNRLRIDGSIEVADQPGLQLQLDGEVDLALLSALLGQGRASGRLAVNRLDLVGPIEEPRLVGAASLASGNLVHPDLPIALANVSAELRFTARQVSIDEFEATTEYGRFSATGGVFLEGFTPARWQINAFGSGLTLEYPEGLRSRFDFDVDFSRNDRSQLLSGVVYLRGAEYQEEVSIPDLVLAVTQNRSVAAPVIDAGETAIDIEVEAYRTIQVTNNLADIIASGDFQLRGTLARPVVLGDLTIDEGTLRVDQTEYDIVRGAIRFDDPATTHPVIDIEADTQIREYDVSINLRGPIEQLRANFRSDPPLSSAEVVSLLATGQTFDELSGPGRRSGALAAYGAGSLLGQTLGQQLTQKTRLFGFDRLSVDPFVDAGEKDPGTRITLGKQITSDLGVTYITKLGGQLNRQAVIIQYRVTDWLTVVGSGEQDGTVAFDFKIRKRF